MHYELVQASEHENQQGIEHIENSTRSAMHYEMVQATEHKNQQGIEHIQYSTRSNMHYGVVQPNEHENQQGIEHIRDSTRSAMNYEVVQPNEHENQQGIKHIRDSTRSNMHYEVVQPNEHENQQGIEHIRDSTRSAMNYEVVQATEHENQQGIEHIQYIMRSNMHYGVVQPNEHENQQGIEHIRDSTRSNMHFGMVQATEYEIQSEIEHIRDSTRSNMHYEVVQPTEHENQQGIEHIQYSTGSNMHYEVAPENEHESQQEIEDIHTNIHTNMHSDLVSNEHADQHGIGRIQDSIRSTRLFKPAETESTRSTMLHLVRKFKTCIGFFYMAKQKKKQTVSSKVEQLRPATNGLSLPVKVLRCRTIKQPIFTARNDQDWLNTRIKVDARTEPTTFTFPELVAATNNFKKESLLGEGAFGRVYKGKLQRTGQAVAVKLLDRNGRQSKREFLVEVLMLSRLHHPNLVNLIGHSAVGDQRLIVYEFMQLGSLEHHLHDVPPDKEPLDWNTRVKIAAGAAKGLEYLHEKINPQIIFRDFKSSNILLEVGFHPKLSDFGLAKLGPVRDKSHLFTAVRETYGYCAPEYALTGRLTVKSDVYSFGVVLLELITGRKAIDKTQPEGQQNLVSWAKPLFNDSKNFAKMADPRLQGQYPKSGLHKALTVASMCIQEQAATRPLIGNVVTPLSYLVNQTYDPNSAPGNKDSGGDQAANGLGRF